MNNTSRTEYRSLFRVATEQGDFSQAAIAELALAGHVDVAEHIQLSDAEASRIGAMTQRQAISICDAVIAYAAGEARMAA